MIKIGNIVTTFGIKGELKLNPLTDNPQRFEDKGPYYIGNSNVEVYIENYRVQKNQIIIKLKGYDNINDVLDFVKEGLFVKEEDRPSLEEDSYYIDELIGLDVYHNNIKIGELKEVIYTGANDIYYIEGEENTYYLPAVKEFILNVNLKENRMDILLIEGMENEV